ncbi:hypothetical protein DPMN_032698 [Dreissena polymorpha]|uniref:Uncharacterized protein n=1 Tax=Dreissena polymorpha TaxID=45954 RepID=A0A9D4M580_DREPO|nr:hypothetical protein DPMN_032698 [Dreissena polymorpha]
MFIQCGPGSSGGQRSHQERTSGSRDDGTRLINRAARGSSHIRPSSGDVVKALSTYGLAKETSAYSLYSIDRPVR